MKDSAITILTFPLWWYTQGVRLLWQWVQNRIRFSLRRNGFSIFLRHIREPLYGDYTRSGVIIGFFLRVVLLVGKALFLGMRILFYLLVMAAYLVVIPLSIIMTIYELFPG